MCICLQIACISEKKQKNRHWNSYRKRWSERPKCTALVLDLTRVALDKAAVDILRVLCEDSSEHW